jgi:uncharacterized protein
VSAAAESLPAFVAGKHLIEAYGEGGFRFAGMSHKGSILATPQGVAAWDARLPDDITAAALAPLFAEAAEHPRSVEILVVGTGDAFTRLPPALAARLRAAGLRFETMATGPAARVYNVLLGENRRVAAALLAAK